MPSPWENLAVPLRPIHDAADPLLDEITGFFAPDAENNPFLVMCMTPTADLAVRGWSTIGHPPIMVRPAGAGTRPQPGGLDIVPVRTAEQIVVFNDTLIEAFPMPELHGLRSFGDGLLELPNYQLWLGLLDGEPVATSGAWRMDDFVDVEWVSTLTSARGRGIGEAMTWTATLSSPELPAMLIASDPGRPIYERMGYVAVSRCTLWVGARG